MIKILDLFSFILEWVYAFVFWRMIYTFLPLRENRILRIFSFFVYSIIAVVIVYSNDLANLLGTLLLMIVYIVVFHCGHWTRKITAVLVFYPALIAVNYLMQDTGSRIFFFLTKAPDPSEGWTKEQWMISSGIHMLTLLLRLLFWLLSWRILRNYLRRITSELTVKMWLLVDLLMLAPFVAIFTIIYFMPENPLIVYPICGASIFSSFGCLYLASYICGTLRTAFHAQELEMKQAYYFDKIKDEERVRSIYHDLKNHLLVLQGQAENGQEAQRSIQGLLSQIQEYENYYHTGNDYLDIIIRDKAKAAQEKQIDFSAVIFFEDGSFMEPLDISTIFGNALDNAIEASEKLPEDQRLITVRTKRVRDLLVITVENYSLSVVLPKGTTKKDTFAHGFGISNINSAVQKYGGQCSIKSEDGVFVVKIVIPVP